MSIALVAHAADSVDRLHLWAGVADVDAVPALTWKLNGNAIVPTTLRPLTKILDRPPADTTVYTGFFELGNLAPSTEITVEVAAGGERVERRFRTLPAQVPEGVGARFNVLLLSCFHRLEDKTGTAGTMLSQLKVKPDLTIFAGDQVYLDLPTTQNFEDNKQWLTNKFQNDYLDNWFGDRRAAADPRAIPRGYPQVLGLAPAAFMPDDHEYWNNYPFMATLIQNSWTEDGRKSWKAAAEALYQGFQQTTAARSGSTRVLKIPPLSILMLDTRSQRPSESRDKPGDLLGEPGRKALMDWISELEKEARTPRPSFGMLVTGQSLFSPAAGAAKGAIADYEFPDYKADYAFMVQQVERVTRAGLPIVLATGDVHWGRVLRADDPGSSGATVFEVISSPTSLVSAVVADQAKEVWGTIKGLFGKADPWPRHSDPALPPPRFGSAGQYSTTMTQNTKGKPAAMRGNQAFMLRFAQAGGGLDVEVTAYPLSDDPSFNAAEQWTTGWQLRPRRNA
jgi:PhoD-like phosphatase